MRFAIIFLSLLFAMPALAHEYWIEPKAYVLPSNSTIVAGLFNGQNFAGFEAAYFEKNFRRFELAMGDQIEPVKGRTGDKPALNMASIGDGLHIALFESAGDTVFYEEFAKFEKFVKHKDFAWALARHAERGLPQGKFKEFYTRHSKALIAVGAGAGEDRAYGLDTEIVALKNPYTDDVESGLPARVLYNGAPRADTQVEYFDKDAAGQVKVTLLRTDADGVVLLPVTKGHSYLVDSVVLREPDAGSKAAASDALWETLWAALTFSVPL